MPHMSTNNPLKRFLQRADMKPGTFARTTGLGRTTVWRIVNGERNPGLFMAQEIERVTLGKVKASDWKVHRRNAA